MLFYGWSCDRTSCINGKSRAELPSTYEGSCPPLNPMECGNSSSDKERSSKMVVVDTPIHASPYWYEPVETLLDQMNRHGVAQATLIQIGGEYDNSYLIECMRRFPGRFAVVGLVDTDRPDAPERLEEWVKQGVEGIRLRPLARSPGRDPLAIWRKAAELGIMVSAQGSA